MLKNKLYKIILVSIVLFAIYGVGALLPMVNDYKKNVSSTSDIFIYPTDSFIDVTNKFIEKAVERLKRKL